MEEISPKSRLAVTLFSFFLGEFGAHLRWSPKFGQVVKSGFCSLK